MAEESVVAAAAAEPQNGAGAAVKFTVMKAEVMVGSKKAEEAVAFYKEAFGAEEVKRSTYPKRKSADQEQGSLLLSAELKIGPSAFLVSDLASDDSHVSGLVFRLEADDVAGAVAKAVKAGAVQEGDIAEEEGGIFAKLKDPFGAVWTISSAAKKSCAEAEAEAEA